MDAVAARLRAEIDAERTPSLTPKDFVDHRLGVGRRHPRPRLRGRGGVGQLLARHYRRERNQTIRKRKIAAVKAAGMPIACEVCDFDFAATYGEVGDGYIEVHHVLPLHASGPTITKFSDLALLCSNCHRMIHRARPWLTPDELRDRLSN